MISKKKIIIIACAAVAAVLVIVVLTLRKSGTSVPIGSIVSPEKGEIQLSVSATGTVLPYNRLEIKPQVNGRMESVLVSEGQYVRRGQILAWMSSTERAALIDAARAQGASSLRYWEDAYKPIAVIAPINGTVIVRGIEPGQAALTTAAILVLSDRLIVKADVDETDIGRVRRGQRAVITLDAYPDVSVKGRVDLIEFESKTVNNVTMYEVNIIPDTVPDVFRSGMTANVAIIEKGKEDALLLPLAAITNDGGRHYVRIVTGKKDRTAMREVRIGMTDDQNVEIVSGLTEKDRVAIADQSLKLDAKNSKNPFMPQRKKLPKQ